MYDPFALGLEIVGGSNDEVYCRCPFPDHDDKHASASFNATNGFLFCFSCHRSAHALRLANMLGGRVVQTQRLRLPRVSSERPWHNLLNSPLALDDPYLQERGVTNEDVSGMMILRSMIGITFPILGDDREALGVTVRQFPGRAPRYLTFGSKSIGWPAHSTFDVRRPAWVVEGPFGAIRARQAGEQALAIMGSHVPRELLPFLTQFPQVYGMFDDDSAGRSAAMSLVHLVPGAKIYVPGAEADELSITEWKRAHQKTARRVALRTNWRA